MEQPANSPWPFKLLFDGECPFCVREVRWLRALDHKQRLLFEDISAPDFRPERYGLDHPSVMAAIHGVDASGHVVTGLEVFRQAYRAVGLGWLTAPTGWPGFRWLSDRLYSAFARNRIFLGRLFGRSCPVSDCSRQRS